MKYLWNLWNVYDTSRKIAEISQEIVSVNNKQTYSGVPNTVFPQIKSGDITNYDFFRWGD